jgi:hypothetical protein
MLPHLTFGSLAVAGAAAFMVPPNMALKAASIPPIPDMVTDPFSIKLFAPCQGCPYAKFKDNGLVWIEGTDNSLFLDVSVNNKLDTMELNGVQIYPPPMPAGLVIDPEVPRIAQIPSTVSLKDVEKNPERYLGHPLKLTGFSLQSTTIHSLKETGEEIIKIQLSISSLEGKAINIPDIVITALKNPEVQLMILNVELQKPHDNGNCNGMPLLCKLKSMLANMRNSIKGKMGKIRGGCHKTRPHHVSAAEQHKEEDLKKPHHRPHHKGDHKGDYKGHKGHHGHHGHHRHQGVHRFLHKVARILLTIVIPLMLGILAGMLTYTFGMLLGTFIALVWMRVRGRRSNYQPIALDDEEDGRPSFDKGQFQEEVYVESPPVYVEIEAKEVGRQE